MTKSELIASIARSTGISKTDTRIVVESLVKTIKDRVRLGESVYFRRFGTFSLRRRKEKIGRDIQKRLSLVIPAKEIAHFKQSSYFFE